MDRLRSPRLYNVPHWARVTSFDASNAMMLLDPTENTKGKFLSSALATASANANVVRSLLLVISRQVPTFDNLSTFDSVLAVSRSQIYRVTAGAIDVLAHVLEYAPSVMRFIPPSSGVYIIANGGTFIAANPILGAAEFYSDNEQAGR